MKFSPTAKCPGWLIVVAVSGGFLCSTANAVAQNGTWTNVASMSIAGVEASGLAYGGQFYVMGAAANGSIQPPQVYDPLTDTWSAKAADPAGRSVLAAGVISNKIYTAEGWINSDANAATTTLEIYDPALNSWTAGANSLVARGQSAAAVIGGKLYITGGNASFAGGDIATLEIYDANANAWSTGAPIPVPSEGAVGAAINGKFYVVGGGVRPAGGGVQPDPATASVFIYDPAGDAWKTGAPMPSPRASAVGGVINGKLYITGGTASNGTNNPVFVYDPAADSWSMAAAEPMPRALGAAAALGGKLFVTGGYDTNSTPTTLTEVFTPAPSLTIASVGNQSVLFWPVSGTNYILQSTTNLASSNWVTASDAMPVIAFTVTNSSPGRFFRLQAQ